MLSCSRMCALLGSHTHTHTQQQALSLTQKHTPLCFQTKALLLQLCHDPTKDFSSRTRGLSRVLVGDWVLKPLPLFSCSFLPFTPPSVTSLLHLISYLFLRKRRTLMGRQSHCSTPRMKLQVSRVARGSRCRSLGENQAESLWGDISQKGVELKKILFFFLVIFFFLTWHPSFRDKWLR